MSIPAQLPVGISRTVQYNNRYQRERDLPEDRHPAFSAHIGFQGAAWSKNFRIEILGEAEAYAQAVEWRALMVRRITSAARKPFRLHAHFNRPGPRRRSLATST